MNHAMKRLLMSSYRDLRTLNRELNFQGVLNEYENTTHRTSLERLKAKEQYYYALTNLAVPEQPEQPKQPEQPEQPAEEDYGSQESPVYVRTVATHWRKDSKGSLEMIVACLILYGFYRNWGSGETLSSKRHTTVAEDSKTRFSDVRGIDECRAELEEIVDFLKNPAEFQRVGAKMPKGVLLTGQPGVGKTLLAKAIAGEAHVKFYYVSGSDFEELFVGLGAKRVRELFREAKNNSPCIVFIDEIDALGSSRKGRDSSHSRQSLNQLLVEMDGFRAVDNVLVIGATNFPENLDNALRRAGRFDKTIDVPLPDVGGREEILALYLAKVSPDASVDKKVIARGTTGMTGADLANLVNLAMLGAVKAGRTTCNSEDIEAAKDRILMGIERKSLVMSTEQKLSTAIHEVGHALTAVLTEGAEPLHKTTILPRGQSLGMTVLLPKKDSFSTTKRKVIAQLDVSMGGRAAEELFFGKEQLSTGCGDDLHKATQLAYHHVRGGLFNEKTGLVNTNALEYEGIAQRDTIDKVVAGLLAESYERVLQKLSEHRKLITQLAEELGIRETLTGEEFMRVMTSY